MGQEEQAYSNWHRLILVCTGCIVIIALAACTVSSEKPLTEDQARVDLDLLLTLPANEISYQSHVRPILARRCVVCHGCYDAPCQLKLSSPQGIERGANKNKVYDGSRILAAEPTRLFIDAKNTAQWREKNFHAVLNEGTKEPRENLENSVLYHMLRLKQRHPQPRVGMLPDSLELGLNRKQTCATLEEFDDFARQHPDWGMPYGMPNLADAEYRSLVQWLAQGAPMPPSEPPDDQARQKIEHWEAFFNAAGNKQRLVSRYLYEHLFQAHLHFTGSGDREFYRLVRSRTASGTPVDEIAARRPFDDPGGTFFYRLLPYHPDIVAKDHVVYELSPERMQRYHELFIDPEFEVDELPPYETSIASNPFKVFRALPPDSRYRFMLDDAGFFIEGFIKGPVCRGQIALNVIEDQFWVMFFDPDHAIFTQQPAFLDRMADDLQLPADRGNTLRLLTIWTDYWQRQKKYIAQKVAYFKTMHTAPLDKALEYIWDGDGSNPNAALTVFRHLDSASVSFGLVGDYPETAWIIDYPLLERIHYLLVAGFDVYGNVGHQLNTRLYMDFLRMEGEDYFLAFLPAASRKPIRDSWYKGVRSDMPEEFDVPMDWLDVESVKGYQTDDPQRELYRLLEQRFRAISRPEHDLDRCHLQACIEADNSNYRKRVDLAMQKVANTSGRSLAVFPDVAFVRVRNGDDPLKDMAYTLIRNNAYTHVTSMFQDASAEANRDFEDDSLTVVDWLEGSYPNFFFVIDIEDIEKFAEHYRSIQTRDDYEQFVGRYGVRRSNENFWHHADWFHERYAREKPVLSGLFDLNRYRNR